MQKKKAFSPSNCIVKYIFLSVLPRFRRSDVPLWVHIFHLVNKVTAFDCKTLYSIFHLPSRKSDATVTF